jgi:hypothetical protein
MRLWFNKGIKNAPDWYGVIIKCTKNQIIKFSHFFDFFLSIFWKMKLKKNVCSNLTTKTSEYRLDVSQLSHQCFTSFLLSLLSKKSKHFYFEFFLENDQKNHISSLRGWVSVFFEPFIELIYDSLISVMTKVDSRNLMVAIILFKTI